MLDNGSDVDKLLHDKHSEAGKHTEAASGPSGSGNNNFADGPPDLDLPSFEQSSADPVYNFDDRQFTIPDGGEEPPPEFEPYTAEYSISWSGDIISHDPHLNQDGEALYRFLLARAQEHPEYVLHCRGTHDEQRTHHETYTDSRGNRQTRLETRTETVTDFDFQIDVAQQFLPGALLWTAPDGEPTYRGGRTRTTKDGQVTVSRAAIKALKKLQQYRADCGFPPWVGSSNTGEVDFDRQFEVLQSSWTLREWADDYCSSDKIFKEFVFEKMVYGWKSSLIIDAVRSAIKSTYYQGDIHVNFDKRLARVIIRRNTRVQRLLSSIWFKILLWLTLIYPFVWLFQRFHPRGYGKWTVAGSAHALTRFYRHGPPPSDHSLEPSRAVVRPEGMRDGEWFRMWEGSIRRMAASRFRSSEAVMVPDGVGVVPNRPALSLDSHNALTYFGA